MRVAIIGAGVAGASAAWHLARAGARPVVIDPSRDGRATAAGAGIVAPWAGSSATDPDWHRRGAAAARDYPAMIAALAEDGESDTGFSNCGALFVAEDRAVLDRVARDLLARRNEAPEMGEISVLDPSQARAAFPPLHPALSAVHIGGGARVDGRRLAASFRRAAVRRGAGELHGAATLVHSAGGVSVRVDGEPVAADTILVAAGAWSAELLAPLGITLKVAPQRGQIVHLRAGPALAALTASWPSVLPDAGSGHYLVAFEAGRLVAGATRETGSGFAYDLTAEGQSAGADRSAPPRVRPGRDGGDRMAGRLPSPVRRRAADPRPGAGFFKPVPRHRLRRHRPHGRPVEREAARPSDPRPAGQPGHCPLRAASLRRGPAHTPFTVSGMPSPLPPRAFFRF